MNCYGSEKERIAGRIQDDDTGSTDDVVLPGYTAWPVPSRSRLDLAVPVERQPPTPMTRVQPEDLDWSWQQAVVYDLELMVELYAQGRSFSEVAAVTGYPADRVRAWVMAAGVARPERVDVVVAAWRSASRARLRKVHRQQLLYTWVDGAEVEEIAAAHMVPADLLWDLIAAEFARLPSRRSLTNHRPVPRRPAEPPQCVATTCLYGCVQTCGSLVPPIEADDVAGYPELARVPGWPPRAQLSEDVAISGSGRPVWTRGSPDPPTPSQ